MWENYDETREVLRRASETSMSARLTKVFADAEKTFETDETEDRLIARYSVKHPQYPESKLEIELTLTPTEWPGVLRTESVKRTVSDDGETPLKALNELARYSRDIMQRAEKRRGGPMPTPELRKSKLCKDG